MPMTVIRRAMNGKSPQPRDQPEINNPCIHNTLPSTSTSTTIYNYNYNYNYNILIINSPSSATQPRTKIHAHFQICRPPPKSTLRLSSKLLLQIQQLPQNHRPVPVLEIWQPPFRKSKLTRAFPSRPKLRSGDIYASTNEPYIINQAPIRKDSTRSDDSDTSDARNKDVVAALCHSAGDEHIYFRDARCSWAASKGTVRSDKTCYRFALGDGSVSGSEGTERMLLQCEKRDSEKGDVEEEFILFLIDRTARRKSRIATMSAGGLEILVRKSSILESLEACMRLCEPVGYGSDSMESWLYTQVLTVAVWVSQREGWHGLP